MSFIPRSGQWVEIDPPYVADLANVKTGELMRGVELTVGIARKPRQAPDGTFLEPQPPEGKTWVSLTDPESGRTLASFVFPYESMKPVYDLDKLPVARRKTANRFVLEAGRILDKRGQVPNVRRSTPKER